jgi:hypothetical protein
MAKTTPKSKAAPALLLALTILAACVPTTAQTQRRGSGAQGRPGQGRPPQS